MLAWKPSEQSRARPPERCRIVTIGVGVLCSTIAKPDPGLRPDAIVMLSDTMGSTDTDSIDNLHKMLIDENRNLYAVCADRIERCGDLWGVILAEVSALKLRTHGGYLEALNKAVLGHRAQHFKYDVLYSKYTVNDKELMASPEVIQQEWENYDSRAAMIVGGFDERGQALQYVIMNPHHHGGKSWVEPTMFPGCTAIGLGAYNATFWLNYRHQHLAMSIRQSVYHAYEASRMAASAPTVNDELEIVVATKDGFLYTASTAAKPAADFPLTLERLRELFQQKGPQSTDDLTAFAKQSTLQTSPGQQ